MQRSPRPRSEGVIQDPMLVRAWLFLGVMASALSLAGFFYVLHCAGWHPGDPVGAAHPLHHAYLEATMMTFTGMIAGQIGTAFAVRTRRTSLRSAGAFSNPYLLDGIAGEIALAALFIYVAPLQSLLGTAGLSLPDLAFLLPCPFIVWGADELRRWALRRRARPAQSQQPSPPDTHPARRAVRGIAAGNCDVLIRAHVMALSCVSRGVNTALR